ncbi:hypothetical protein RchiOBHm_Chr7g0232501 [Rosa chinensis]|uniref:Uncharacterized protein n=1 Tax=Rosa chinensis TaxID=74649 RepID=A0A2P6PFZ9_ROSCH|nr:hypothetical protein RchiOBHm_Chr7g0232501 [Rosa chinensis]
MQRSVYYSSAAVPVYIVWDYLTVLLLFRLLHSSARSSNSFRPNKSACRPPSKVRATIACTKAKLHFSCSFRIRQKE